jgi:hypothetical protein
MEDFAIDVMIGRGPSARSLRLTLKPFTVVGATTRAGRVGGPLRDRFGAVYRLDYYTEQELATIVSRSAGILSVDIDAEAVSILARRGRGTPRVVNRLLRRVRDYALGPLRRAYPRRGGDGGDGGDGHRRRRARHDRPSVAGAIVQKFASGPVGGGAAVAAVIGEEIETIEDVYEPYLLAARLSRPDAAGGWQLKRPRAPGRPRLRDPAAAARIADMGLWDGVTAEVGSRRDERVTAGPDLAGPDLAGLAVATRGVFKRYGRQPALRGLDMSVPTGKVYGFLGPNGSGKTTTLRLLAGLISPDAGSLTLFGQPYTWRDRTRLFRVGSLIETPAFYPYLSGRGEPDCHRRHRCANRTKPGRRRSTMSGSRSAPTVRSRPTPWA